MATSNPPAISTILTDVIEPGAVVHLPPAEAKALMAAGDAFPILPQPEPGDAATPLHVLIRSRLDDDPELGGLAATARRYASRGVPHCPEAAARLRRMLPPLPTRLAPASFITDDDAPAGGWYAETYLPEVRDAADRKLALLAFHIRRVRVAIIAAVFDAVRKGARPARGLLPSGDHIEVPPEVWSAGSVVVDLGTGVVTTAGKAMFVTVTVEPPPPAKPRLPCSPAAIRQFIGVFATEMLALNRVFSQDEAVEAVHLELGSGISAERTGATLRELKPSSWHRRGRRARDVIPTAIEIAGAARAARLALENAA
jgi:hypothetical protein